MKKLLSCIWILLVLLCLLTSCAQPSVGKDDVPQSSETDENGRYVFTAKVLSVSEGSLLVECENNSGGIREGNQAYVSKKGMEIDVKKGDRVRIVFDGMVMETYPLQIDGVFEILSLTKE